MFLTESQSRARLESKNNLANRFGKHASISEDDTVKASKIQEITLHRTGSKPELHQKIVDEIAIRARSGENQRGLAEEFGIKQQTVSKIEHGKTPKSKAAHIDSVLSEVRDRALEKLMKSMGLMDDDKLAACHAKDLSAIAANMSRVIERTIPQEGSNGNNIQVVIYTPEARQEKYYKTVEI